MNKKLALLLFAIGLGAASAHAADSCQWSCLREWQACEAAGGDPEQCTEDRSDCYARCGI